jgi:hypothetical protein
MNKTHNPEVIQKNPAFDNSFYEYAKYNNLNQNCPTSALSRHAYASAYSRAIIDISDRSEQGEEGYNNWVQDQILDSNIMLSSAAAQLSALEKLVKAGGEIKPL